MRTIRETSKIGISLEIHGVAYEISIELKEGTPALYAKTRVADALRQLAAKADEKIEEVLA